MVTPMRFAHQAMPHRAIPSRVAQPVIRSSASSPITSAPGRTVRTRAVPESATSWLSFLTPEAVLALFTVGGSVAAIVMLLQSSIKDGNTALQGQLQAELTKVQVELTKLAGNDNLLNSKLDNISKDVAALNASVSTLSANVQAQQIQSAFLQGQLNGMQGTPTATPPNPTANSPTPTPTVTRPNPSPSPSPTTPTPTEP